MHDDKEINFRFNLYENKYFYKKFLKIFTLCIAAILFYCLTIMFILTTYSKKVSDETSLIFFEKSPDLIAVFTGDKGRIAYAFSMLAQYPESKLLISGVYSKNTIQSLIQSKALNLPANFNEELLSQVVELDYQAKNTLENVLMTMQMIRKDLSIKKVLIVSSDYHLLRVKLIFSLLDKYHRPSQLYFMGVESEQSFLKKLIDASIEGIKIMRTFGLYFFWNDEDYGIYEENSN